MGSTRPVTRQGGLPPGPALPPVAQLLRYAARPEGWLRRCGARYGDTFTLRVATLGTVVFFTDEETTRAIISGDPKIYHASEINMVELMPIVGPHSSFTLDEGAHARSRQLLSPFFGRDRSRDSGDMVEEVALREVGSWPRGRPFALRPHMQDLTLQVMLRVTFGDDVAPRLAELARAITRMVESGTLVLPLPALRRDLGPWSPWGRFVRARARVDALVYSMIDERRAARHSAGRADVLSRLATVTDGNGDRLSRKEIRDHVVTVLIAGLETTSTALSWTFHELARDPAAQRRVRAERAGGEDAYAKAVVKESLRLHPPVLVGPVPMVTDDVTLKGFRIPAGTFVTPGTTLIHHDPENYPDPDRFLPDRFLNASPPAHRYLPYGWGPHRCVGANLASIEMERVLGAVLERVTVAPTTPKPEPGVIRYVTCAPKNGARVVAEPAPR
ncbi:cytochrome P450 [Actinomadura sp. 3N407]|uniref:cytochrome P450 n=1 Tax=Actinomadura sp. 3N407 TaxID=3457423 RepID=UPI003FCEAE40